MIFFAMNEQAQIYERLRESRVKSLQYASFTKPFLQIMGLTGST